ncbi:UNVERIFIED_CONTAM: hypothetical protein K2H54_004406 [Gekko kuhli]
MGHFQRQCPTIECDVGWEVVLPSSSSSAECPAFAVTLMLYEHTVSVLLESDSAISMGQAQELEMAKLDNLTYLALFDQDLPLFHEVMHQATPPPPMYLGDKDDTKEPPSHNLILEPSTDGDWCLPQKGDQGLTQKMTQSS